MSMGIIIYFFFFIAKCNPGTSRSLYSRVLIKMKVSGFYHGPTDLDPLMVNWDLYLQFIHMDVLESPFKG